MEKLSTTIIFLSKETVSATPALSPNIYADPLLVVILRLRPDIDSSNSYIDVYGSMHRPKRMKVIIEKIRQGFNSGLKPKLTDEGTSGSYEMRNA